MDEQIRQRLVGAAVLVALGVIFIPMLFDSPNKGWLGEDRPLIPPQPHEIEELAEAPVPEIEPLPQARPDEPSEPPEREPVHTSETPRTEAKEERLARWAVQVGSFSSRQNAIRLRDSLRQQGFQAYTEETEESGRHTTRVRVGPVLDEVRAKRLKDQLSAKADVEGILVRHR